MHSRGMLAVAVAKLKEQHVPLSSLAPVRSHGPPAAWAALLLLQCLALLQYAASSPASLGAGRAELGFSYGLVRLALIVSMLGSLAHAVSAGALSDAGDELLLEALDAAQSGLTGLGKRPRLLQSARRPCPMVPFDTRALALRREVSVVGAPRLARD